MYWVLVYSWMSLPMDAHVRVVAAFENPAYCELMKENMKTKGDHFACIPSRLEYEPTLTGVDSFHIITQIKKRKTFPPTTWLRADRSR